MLAKLEPIPYTVRVKPSDQIRKAVERSGLSRYEIGKRTGIAQSVLSRFMAGSGISTETIDKLADVIELRITSPPKRRKGR